MREKLPDLRFAQLAGVALSVEENEAAHPEEIALLRMDAVMPGSEYNRGTGCGKTARPGLCRGRRVTGAPTARDPSCFWQSADGLQEVISR
jgi:hypothetical protein